MSVKLAAVDISAANTNTTVWNNATGNDYVVNIYFCDRNPTHGTVKMAIGASATPANQDWLLYDEANVESFTGIPVANGEFITVASTNNNVGVQVRGGVA